MIDRGVALEALSVLCNANVTSVQKQQGGISASSYAGGPAAHPTLHIKNFISTVLNADETCFSFSKSFPQSGQPAANLPTILLNLPHPTKPPPNHPPKPLPTPNHVIDEDEFFDPRFDYDFTNLKDTETYHRGGEVYERPCGWSRFALKVLDKYTDGNAWLGNLCRSTESVPGEWPVSYHGTSEEGVDGVIEGHYKAGSGQRYGRGIYSTPYISEVIYYAKMFVSKTDGKTYKLILQNRINPEYKEKHNKDKYWVVSIPDKTSDEKEQELVERAIRPYGVLLKAV